MEAELVVAAPASVDELAVVVTSALVDLEADLVVAASADDFLVA